MLIMRVFVLLLLAGLPGGLAAQAQQLPAPKAPPPPEPARKVLTVHLPLPSLVARLGELTGLLISEGKRKKKVAADENPVLILVLPLPKFIGGGDPDKPRTTAPLPKAP